MRTPVSVRERQSEIRLDEARTGVDVDLAQDGFAGVDEAVRRVRWDDNDAARRNFPLFVADSNPGGSLKRECDFHVRMGV